MMNVPRMTIELAQLRDKADGLTGRDRWKARYDLVKKVVDDVDERLGGKKFEQIDLAALDVLYMDVCDAWDEPVRERESERTARAYEGVNQMDLDKVLAIIDAAERLNGSRNVFRNLA